MTNGTASRLMRLQDWGHTCLVEFLPGPYRDECWNAASVYLDESDFWEVFRKSFERCYPNFDYYAFQDIPASVWRLILADLAHGAEDPCLTWQRATVEEFSDWIEATLKTHDVIAFLGM